MSVGTALRIVHFAYYTERENNERYALWLLLTLDVCEGKTRVIPINGQIVRVHVGICLVAHRGIFLAVCTRDFPRVHHAQMHTHTAGLADVFCTELRTGRFGGSSEIQSLAPRPLEQSFVPFLPFFSFFLSFSTPCKTTMQNKITGSWYH